MRIQRSYSVFLLVLFTILTTQISAFENEDWSKVQTKNFTLIGNAGDKKIEKVGIKLEQFREALRRLFPTLSSDSPISTTVIVFDGDKSFHPYKPINSKGEITEWVAGYFQSGFDRNYIALTFGQENELAYQTIFHEYTHYLIDHNLGRTNIPPWYSEGLSEFYDQFDVENDRVVRVGGKNNTHLQLLEKHEIIPLEEFFAIDYKTLRLKNRESANHFYAQSWALMHFLLKGESGKNKEKLDEFIQLVLRNVPAEIAFKKVFQESFLQFEVKLRKHIKNGNFNSVKTKFNSKLTSDIKISNTSISYSEVQAVLGDLLFQRQRYKEAESHLLRALEIDPTNTFANSTLGLVKMKQGNFIEARKYLQKAVKKDGADFTPYFRFAYFLSRENMTFDNFISEYSDDRTYKMRELLNRSINLNPDFPESYSLLAFINLVRNENIDEGIEILQKALNISPEKPIYLLNLAEFLIRKKEFEKARLIVKDLSQNSEEDYIKTKAQDISEKIIQLQEQIAKREKEELQARSNSRSEDQISKRRSLTEEELEKNRKQTKSEAISEVLRKPQNGEKRVVGQISDITCSSKSVLFTITSENTPLKLKSDAFNSLTLMTFTSEMRGINFGCNVAKKDILAVITYKPFLEPKNSVVGDIISIEFVPQDFILAIND